jgi:hypothetical protein
LVLDLLFKVTLLVFEKVLLVEVWGWVIGVLMGWRWKRVVGGLDLCKVLTLGEVSHLEHLLVKFLPSFHLLLKLKQSSLFFNFSSKIVARLQVWLAQIVWHNFRVHHLMRHTCGRGIAHRGMKVMVYISFRA